jgi:hypothetical protein
LDTPLTNTKSTKGKLCASASGIPISTAILLVTQPQHSKLQHISSKQKRANTKETLITEEFSQQLAKSCIVLIIQMRISTVGHRPLEDDSESLLELLGLPHLTLLICASFSINMGEALPHISTSSSTGSPPATPKPTSEC